jgi:dinuclear metal center YbgI/SA1388 family protein
MKITVKDLADCIETIAPPALQETWDNSGLLVGNPQAEIDTALLTIDVTEAVVDEAIATNCQLIVAHHPLLFGGIKRLTGKTDTERAVIKAIRNNIAIYAAHTNIDVVKTGVSYRMAEKLDLVDLQTLAPQKGLLKKLVVFVPETHVDKVRNAIFEAGAGHIGAYDSCSFNLNGTGTFKGNEGSDPFVGEKGTMHFEPEVRIETVMPSYLQNRIVQAMLAAHPYEEVAYDLYTIDNLHPTIGLGVIGNTVSPVETSVFLQKVKTIFGCRAVKHTSPVQPYISRIALCGGSGSSLIRDAINANADLFITADLKYHQYFEAENRIVLADIGHYESEQFTKELFFEIVTNKFPKFALRLSNVQTNPVNYLF